MLIVQEYLRNNCNPGIMEEVIKADLVFSDALDVDFELRDDVWDDIDDEKLVFASNFASRELVFPYAFDLLSGIILSPYERMA
ncbi:probable ATP-dependent DNA helicase HFM1 [Grus japonensis]|uniref:Probable ATP-dependent DNA helicase HFM1 n=1 Tax=Grus japonensis TaxID=30415 RepID=A0ABC9X5N7_GRUJA